MDKETYKKENEVVKKISSLFKVESDIQRKRRIWIRVDKKDLLDIAGFIKNEGFDHLSSISVTDLIEKKLYEISYHVWSYSNSILLTIITKINRSKPFINSVMSIWKSAQIHERELHELFGVKFKDNPDLTPLFLEDWNNMPPFRKDFNWRDYVKDEFYNKENKREEQYWDILLKELYKERIPTHKLRAKERIINFEEVSKTCSEKEVTVEASRCLQCEDPAPCVEACPAGVDIKKYVKEASDGNYWEAMKTILEKLPSPATLGRVCPNPCEEACSRTDLEAPIAIRDIKRFIADQFMDKNWYPKTKEKKKEKIAVIGSGPAGLTAARQLAFNGYSIKVFESNSCYEEMRCQINKELQCQVYGGMKVQTIPNYRLPPKIAMKEIEEIRKLGVDFIQATLGKDSTIKSLFREDYTAILLAIGSGKSSSLDINGRNLKGVFSAIQLLSDIKKQINIPNFKGKHTIVVGGGNTAIDIARSVRRLGAKVTIVYRRSLEQMPANKEEIEEAKEEGIEFKLLTNPKRVLGKKRVEAVECIKMRLGPVDKSGRRRPTPIEGSEFKLKTDFFIEAIGQLVDKELLDSININLNRKGFIMVDNKMMTNLKGVFGAGDAVNGPSTIIEAIASGLKAAEAIKEYCGRNKKT